MRTLRSALGRAVVVALVVPVLGALPVPKASAAGPTAQLPTANPANFTPNVRNGEVDSIFQVGNTVIIGGTFTQVANATANGGTVYNRSSLAAFNATTGVVSTTFNPVIDADITTIIPAADGTSIYVAGDFNSVNGVTRRKVARINIADGSLVNGFNAGGIDGIVRDMKLLGSELLISGLFRNVAGTSRTNIASLDATSGALTPRLNLAVDGQHNDGSTNVIKFEITPAGDRLLMIGNFTSVDGQLRDQIAMLDISTSPATLTPWYTDWFEATCASAFDSYMRDVDISEDGTYAVITTTGAYRAGLACDSDSRFEIDNTSSSNAPTWTNWTGGDTSYAVEIHNGVAYIGGHMRWANNPSAGDRAGQGAVPRPGMMALDVETGLPFSWNPGRERGVGLFDYHVTAAGLWAGSDTDRWNGELRQRLAFFPWAGGSEVPQSTVGDLPGNVVQLGQTGGSTGTDTSVLYRVNAAGPALASIDDGPDWEADNSASSPYRNSGSSVTTSTLTVGTYDATVPTADNDRPPSALFATERWDAGASPEMSWSFPVPAGTAIQVRLYMANKSGNTDEVGDRIFDVRLDGDLVIDNLDLVATPGHNIGTMRAFNIVSDGTVNIVFEHGPIQNPLVNGIEIIRRNVSLTGTFGQQDQVRRVAYDGAATATQTGPFAGTVAWHSVRGAFMVNSTLFTLHSDGTLVRRSFDGTTFGPGTATYTYANNIIADAPNMTGIFFDPETSRIYYTLSTSNTTLYYRSFLPESGVISALRFTQSGGAVAQLDPSRVHGMFLADGQIWFGDDNTGQLMKIGFAGGTPTGSDSLADANTYWTDGRAMFLTSLAPVNVAPTAAFTAACVDATCEFDAAGSTDPDGLIANYEWDFGDGQIGLGSGASHTYAASGNYTVTLTVSDADLATGTTQQVVSVTVPGQPPPPPPPVEPGYNPLAAPSRILDTRADGQTVDALYAATGIRPLGSTLDLPVVGRAGVPADATAVVLNVTVTEGQGPGFITVFPCGEPQPTASSLNYVAGKNIPNLVISKIGAGGAVCFFNSAATHLVVDVAGFYTGAQSFAPLAAPARLLDTRSDGVTVDGLSMGEGIRPAGTVQTLQVTTRAGVPAGAASVVLNVTVDQPETAGFVTAFPCDATLPTASNVNFVAGQTVPNAVVSKLSAAGTVCLFTSATTHLVVDISGYFADTSFVVPLAAPARLLDTRADGTTIDGAFVAGGLRPTGGTLQLAVSGRANIPATASAVVLNVTVDQPAADGFITVYPSDSGRPNASNLNYIVGQTVPNAVIARLGPGGTVCLFNSGATHLVVDVAAYITGTAPPSTGAACPPDPA